MAANALSVDIEPVERVVLEVWLFVIAALTAPSSLSTVIEAYQRSPLLDSLLSIIFVVVSSAASTLIDEVARFHEL